MRKLISIVVAIAFIFSSATMVLADSKYRGDNRYLIISRAHKEWAKVNKKDKEKDDKKENKNKWTFKINGSSVIKYGRYQLPISPVAKGMSADVDYDKDKGVITIEKGSTKIVLDLKNEYATINGVKDENASVFKEMNKNKTIVLIQYIASILGFKVDRDDDDDDEYVIIPNLDNPKNIKINTFGSKLMENTINSTTINMTVTADITAGQATGGKAELYVGSKLVAFDTLINPDDTFVNFNIGTTDNAGLRTVIPFGGKVSIKLYNKDGQYVTSGKDNPKLVVDYELPVFAGVTSAVYNAEKGHLIVSAAVATHKGDDVDVTKITLYDVSLQRFHTLTDDDRTGSKGNVNDDNQLVIKIGSFDKAALKDFQGNDVTLIFTAGTLLSDVAGNTFELITPIQGVPVTVSNSIVTGLASPTNVKITTLGVTTLDNTINSSTVNLTAIANIIAGQATGGKAELYVDNRLVATDNSILPYDTFVNFDLNSTSNAALKAIVPEGGKVTVKLYDISGRSVVSKENVQLTVDYVDPTVTGISSAVYVAKERKLYIVVNGASDVGDSVDVTKIILFDAGLAKSVILTSDNKTGSTGSVVSSNSLVVNVGSSDHSKLNDFGGSDVYLSVPTGSLIYDKAGNVSTAFTTVQNVPLIILR